MDGSYMVSFVFSWPNPTQSWHLACLADLEQDVDVLAVLDFQIPCFHQPRRPQTKNRTSATTLGTGTRSPKIQDGEAVEVLRKPGDTTPRKSEQAILRAGFGTILPKRGFPTFPIPELEL